MLKTIAEWAARKFVVLQIQERIRRLESTVTLAEQTVIDAKQSVQFTRLLLSGGELLEFTGTESEISDAARGMSHRTKRCVTVAVVVAYHHRRGCADLRTSGLDAVGN